MRSAVCRQCTTDREKTSVDAHMQLVLDLMNRFRPTNNLYTAFDLSAWSPS